ncbi:MAG: Asp-tRNA(Asn)/Glu-tRNA(Gln) amidotransferase subunit GatC [Bacteroidota bacterium]
MTVDDALLSHLAKLAKLDPSTAERQRLAGDLKNILAMVEKLQELNLEVVEPLRYVSEVENDLRPDKVENELPREAAMNNAPDVDQEEQFFRVPKVIQ